MLWFNTKSDVQAHYKNEIQGERGGERGRRAEGEEREEGERGGEGGEGGERERERVGAC